MSINESTAAEAQANNIAPTAPKGYGKWFTAEYKDIPTEPTISQRKEAIEAYFAGYTACYNEIKGREYTPYFEWTDEVSLLADCRTYTLHVFVTPPPTIIKSGTLSALASAPITGMSGGDGDDIDPPTPPPPPPPRL